MRSILVAHWLVWLALLGCAGGACAWWPDAAPARRRSRCTLAIAPVDLTLVKLDALTAGRPFRLQLKAVAKADCDDVALALELPAGSTRTAGATTWSGALAKGESHVLEVGVSVPDLNLRTFTGAVEVRRGAALLVRQTALEVGSAGRRLSKAEVNPVIIAPDGTRMMVLPAREVSP